MVGAVGVSVLVSRVVVWVALWHLGLRLLQAPPRQEGWLLVFWRDDRLVVVTEEGNTGFGRVGH